MYRRLVHVQIQSTWVYCYTLLYYFLTTESTKYKLAHTVIVEIKSNNFRKFKLNILNLRPNNQNPETKLDIIWYGSNLGIRTSQREVLAYKALAESSLGPFLCRFHGIRKVGDLQYMELDSAYEGLQGQTATLDIKIGKKTWEDDASPSKVAKESKKFDEVYAQSSAMDGFRVAGMKAGDLALNSKNLKARFSLKTEEFASWLLPAFFASPPGFGPLPSGLGKQPENRSCEIDMVAAGGVLEILRDISAAAERGFGGTLRASSLLLTREMRLGGKCRVHLIDFAHFAPANGTFDGNFCHGLRNLIDVWQTWCPPAPERGWCFCCGARK